MSKEKKYRYEYHKKYGKKRRETPGHKAIRKEYHKTKKFKQAVRNCVLKKKYGISFEEYNDLFEAQNRCCAICHRHQNNFKKLLSVDHDHKTGKVRGLLCVSCNMMLGLAHDNMDVFALAIRYLNR